MITGIDSKQTIDFVSKYDKGEPKTIWKIGILDYRTFMRISNNVGSDDKDKAQEYLREAVKHGLKGVENYNIAFSNSDEFLDSIPPMLVIELSAVIMKNSTLSEEETKN